MTSVFTYASGLELNSPRFTQPGDFFTYVFFVATAILVSSISLSPCSFAFLTSLLRFVISLFAFVPPCFCFTPRISARPAIFLAEAVPGNEGDYPCGTYGSIIRKSVKGPYAVQAWWWLD